MSVCNAQVDTLYLIHQAGVPNLFQLTMICRKNQAILGLCARTVINADGIVVGVIHGCNDSTFGAFP